MYQYLRFINQRYIINQEATLMIIQNQDVMKSVRWGEVRCRLQMDWPESRPHIGPFYIIRWFVYLSLFDISPSGPKHNIYLFLKAIVREQLNFPAEHEAIGWGCPYNIVGILHTTVGIQPFIPLCPDKQWDAMPFFKRLSVCSNMLGS